MVISSAASVKQTCLQQTPKARITVLQTQLSWQHVTHPRIDNIEQPVHPDESWSMAQHVWTCQMTVVGVGSKLKVEDPIFCPPHFSVGLPLFFWALHFNFRGEIEHVIYWSALLSCLSEYSLNIFSKLWFDFEMSKNMLEIQAMTMFLVIYLIKVSLICITGR